MTEVPETSPKVYTSGFVCVDAIREAGADLLTAIRITDTFIPQSVTVTPKFPDGTPDLGNETLAYAPITFFLILKFSTEGPRKFEVNIGGRKPSGKPLDSTAKTIRCYSHGGAAGHMLKVKSSINVEEFGLYWFDVNVDGVLAIRLPIQILATNEVLEEQKRLAQATSDALREPQE